jgi:ABC-type microcin C transport system permease subunit YejE
VRSETRRKRRNICLHWSPTTYALIITLILTPAKDKTSLSLCTASPLIPHLIGGAAFSGVVCRTWDRFLGAYEGMYVLFSIITLFQAYRLTFHWPLDLHVGSSTWSNVIQTGRSYINTLKSVRK